MAMRGRAVIAVLASVLLAGCSGVNLLPDWPRVPRSATPTPSPSPSLTTESPTPSVPASPTPTSDPEREQYPYSGRIDDGSCVPATRGLLDELEQISALPPGVGFSHGALVKSDDPWWTVAVATRVSADAQADVDMTLWFVTNTPSVADGHTPSTWPLDPDADDDAADRALLCLSRVSAPPPEPPEDSPKSYTGRLAPGATCAAASAELLRHLEAVGRVGGAITYPRGQMVQANKNWWTIAVATEVHPNSLGHTRENVPKVVFFVTNAPSKASGAVYFTPDSIKDDTAAQAAQRCLGE